MPQVSAHFTMSIQRRDLKAMLIVEQQNREKSLGSTDQARSYIFSYLFPSFPLFLYSNPPFFSSLSSTVPYHLIHCFILPPIGNNEAHTLSNMVAFSLHYFGCSTDDIWHVLQSYGYTRDRDSVANYISYNNLADGRGNQYRPENERKSYSKGTFLEDGDSVYHVAIDYRDFSPIQVEVSYNDLPQMDLADAVEFPSGDGWLVCTHVGQGQVLRRLI